MTPAATSRAIAKDAAPPAPGEPGLSIVIPLFNEAASLPGLNQRVCEVLRRLRETRGLRSEIVYVDDGSHDATLAIAPRAAAALGQLRERNRFFKGLATWIGFRQIRVDYEPAERAHGSTAFQLRSLVGLSIEGLTSFSVAPLRLASLLGLLLAATALLFGGIILVQTLIYEESVPGYPSLIVGLMVLGGGQLIMIGIMGEYIW